MPKLVGFQTMVILDPYGMTFERFVNDEQKRWQKSGQKRWYKGHLRVTFTSDQSLK